MKSGVLLRVMVLLHLLLPLTALVLPVCPVHADRLAFPPIPGLEFPREAPMHKGASTRIATDAKGRWLISTSLEGTARVWEINSGRLLTVLPPRLGKGDEGKLYCAVALSPDGATAALAGCTGYNWHTRHSIDLFERSGGWLLRRISGLPSAIHRLAFSPNGRWLSASLEGKHGVRVFETKSGRVTGQDRDYGGDSYCIDFSRDGRRVVTTSHDGQVRLYAVGNGALHRIKQAAAPGGEIPLIARFSPDGKQIAVVFKDIRAVNVLDAGTLSPAFAPDTRGIDCGDLGAVA